MTIPTTESRLKNGTLTIDGADYPCQATNVRIVPPKRTAKNTQTEEVLCGYELPSEETSSGDGWTLVIEAIQDFTDPDGFVNMTWDKEGKKVPASWKPTETGPTFSGEIEIVPVEIGGVVNKRLKTTAEFPFTSKPTRA